MLISCSMWLALHPKITATGTKVLVLSHDTKVDIITAADGIGRPARRLRQ